MDAAAAAVPVEELTSGASGRIIPVFKNLRQSILSYESLRRSLLLIYSFFVWILLLLPRLHRISAAASPPSSPRTASASVRRRKFGVRRDEEDTMRRRALAEAIEMAAEDSSWCRWTTSLFFGVRRNALFCRSWLPVSGELRGILIIIHGLNEHSGRYSNFAKQLVSCKFGAYAMDWIGHGGSDGLHGYVPSLDHVVADTAAFLEKIKSENPDVPCFLFGHSTGGAVVLKAASYPHVEEMLEGVVLTSPALRVKPAHPIVGAVAPIFSLVAPRFQFKGANKRGIPVSRDPAALLAKYSDPLVYTGPIRVRTGHEILRISSYLMRNFRSVTVPFFVLHGTADRVTDPLASQDLYNEAPSKFKNIKLYEGFLHDLLFEPEREEIAQDIIDWMEIRLTRPNLEDAGGFW
ncbi:LOW QUALITY PROTEIN: caffeoylshikimate esterase [Salvia miltiorrhiza]|uniref:LOW QUALITY PROTEIN: caffeoylshikimate esterase n=1 Tax=Salvia miltiorrhiza TaxID=226208 RepID=UPI0025AC9BF4|nr:LOW QUALITY PROTEIN: caffeoylshikimate esterase [Salvia miltiorrhiza]